MQKLLAVFTTLCFVNNYVYNVFKEANLGYCTHASNE